MKSKFYPVTPEDVKLAYALTMSLGSPSEGAFNFLMAGHLNLMLKRRSFWECVKRLFERDKL
jgi:hypothetical protein